MPKVSDEHRAAQRRRIQEAAMAVAARNGLGNLTMGDIIKESGLSAGAIYGYYAGKDDLVLEVAEQILGDRRQLVDEITERTPLPPPSAMLEELLGTIPAGLVDNGLLLQFWGELGQEGAIRSYARRNLTTLMEGIRLYLVRWLESRGVPTPQAVASAGRLAPVASGLAQGYILQAGVLGEGMGRPAYLAAIGEVFDGSLAG